MSSRSAKFLVRSRVRAADGSLGPWRRRCFEHWRPAAAYICHGETKIAIFKGAQIVSLRGAKNVDGVFTPVEPKEVVIAELWIHGKRVEGDDLKTRIAFGIGHVERKDQQSKSAIEQLDRDLAAIGREEG